MTVRVASYNLRAFRDDTDALVEVVRRIDPDVLLVQEAPRSLWSRFRLRTFARRTGLRWTGRTAWLAGTTIMTSHRVQAEPSLDRHLPVAGRIGTKAGNPRSWTATTVHLPGAEPLLAVSIHLSLIGQERLEHAHRLLRLLGAQDPDPAEPDLPSVVQGSPDAIGRLVIGGDLNESIDGPAWTLLGQRLREVGPDRATFPARAPRRRIDTIFAGSQLRVTAGPEPELPPDLLAAATDHLPVWVDLDVGDAV